MAAVTFKDNYVIMMSLVMSCRRIFIMHFCKNEDFVVLERELLSLLEQRFKIFK